MTWRWQQLAQWIQPDFRLGAEIGVKEGRCISYLLRAFPELMMIAVDPWETQPEGNETYQGWDFRDIYQQYKTNIIDVEHRIIEMRDYSTEAAFFINDETLDFVFIDAQHDYDSVCEDIKAWLPKIKAGGFISGHDYDPDPERNYGVIQAVTDTLGEITTGDNFTWMKQV